MALIVVVVFAFRSVFFEPFRIPSGSMIPTLMIGDFILVNKFAYGFKVPFSDMYWDPIYITETQNPKRGDVIVFKYPKSPDLNYIKRVVGLPGDRVEIIDKIVFINGKPIEVNEIPGKKIMADMDDKFKKDVYKFYKAQTGNHKHIIQLKQSQFTIATWPEITVPKDHFFVMGDNRDNSSDSRFWGFVPFRHIKGRAMFVWFSMIFPFSDNPFKFRPYRIGTGIH